MSSDAIWRQRSGSTLAQVMACCLTAPSQYLNQYWLIITHSSVRSRGIHLRAISYEIPQPPFTKISLKITYLKLNWNLPGANEFNIMYMELLATNWNRTTTCHLSTMNKLSVFTYNVTVISISVSTVLICPWSFVVMMFLLMSALVYF